MQQPIVSIRMDEPLKKRFEFICDELGLSVSAAITIFAKQVCREGRIPFEITLGKDYEEKTYMSKEISYKVTVFTSEDFFKPIEKNFSNLDDAIKFIREESEKKGFEFFTRICHGIEILNLDSHRHIILFDDNGLTYIRDHIYNNIKYDENKVDESDDYLYNIIYGYIKALIKN